MTLPSVWPIYLSFLAQPSQIKSAANCHTFDALEVIVPYKAGGEASSAGTKIHVNPWRLQICLQLR